MISEYFIKRFGLTKEGSDNQKMKNGEKTKFLSDKVQLLGVTSYYYLASYIT